MLCKYHPEIYSFQRIPWFVVGTLTWANRERRSQSDTARKDRAKDFNLLLFQTARRLNKRRDFIKKTLAIVSVEEFHLTGEMHWHFLMRDSGLDGIQARDLADLMASLWVRELHPFDSIAQGIGTAVIAPYDYQTFEHCGANYICKKQKDWRGNLLEKNFIYSDGFFPSLDALHFASPSESIPVDFSNN